MRYNPESVDVLGAVTSPPYDVMDRPMIEALLCGHARNIVRLILPAPSAPRELIVTDGVGLVRLRWVGEQDEFSDAQLPACVQRSDRLVHGLDLRAVSTSTSTRLTEPATPRKKRRLIAPSISTRSPSDQRRITRCTPAVQPTQSIVSTR